MQKTYQYGLSEKYHSVMYDIEGRMIKARKIISVISHYFLQEKRNISTMNALDIGCSNGIMTSYFGNHFLTVAGIDIDSPAVDYAIKHNKNNNIRYYTQDAMHTNFSDQCFDVIICAHVYEHVPDSTILMKEIYRLLKHGGICYFASGNRLKIIEGHYKLPLLSIIPKFLAHKYLFLFKKEKYYYENHKTLWGLKKISSRFQIIDYTQKIIENPEKFYATDLIKPNSLKQKIYLFLIKYFYWACPTYIWLLRKPEI